jgi:hypothetical protein
MTDYEINRRVAMYSNETLCDLVASTSKKDVWFRIAARKELARRDFVATFEFNPTHDELVRFMKVAA